MDYSNLTCDPHLPRHSTEVLRILGGPLLPQATALHEGVHL